LLESGDAIFELLELSAGSHRVELLLEALQSCGVA
jgi:hypothetical protein